MISSKARDRKVTYRIMTNTPDDGFLLAAMASGDAAALRQLMLRYDRAVRYAIFKRSQSICIQDPYWLDSIASESWAAFVTGLRNRPDDPPQSVRSYLLRIAQNRCISAIRSRRAGLGGEALEGPIIDELGHEDDPSDNMAQLELLEALRACMGGLDEESQRMAGELDAITGRRWKVAAQALGMSESTLRSRWGRVLDQLRGCVAQKTGISLAPGGADSD
ncbi:MAG: RNA polymerase sigma factor [Phycisphaerae bacterium]